MHARCLYMITKKLHCSYPPQMMPMKQPVSPYMDEFPFQMPLPGTTETNYHHQHHHPSPPAPVQQQRFDPYRPRRRREMQAITKIVETREYPYVDGYFWKNNGNTVQKKTGNKSVYYKCSNSTKVKMERLAFRNDARLNDHPTYGRDVQSTRLSLGKKTVNI